MDKKKVLVVFLICIFIVFILTKMESFNLELFVKSSEYRSKSNRDINQQFNFEKRYKKRVSIAEATLLNPSENREKIQVIVIVNTAPKRYLRRMGSRDTWMKECNNRYSKGLIKCMFMADDPDTITNKNLAKNILEESKKHHDMVFFKERSAGLRQMQHMKWIAENYDFEYLLRLDDDVMLCVDHFLRNLMSFPPGPHLWGWLHCYKPGMTYIDEGIQMFTADLVYKFFSQKKETIKCHNIGDQTIAVWLKDLKLNTRDVVIADNDRIHHDPPASHINRIIKGVDVCHRYIAIHGVYAKDMRHLWKRRGSGRFNLQPIFPVKEYCKHAPSYNWKHFKIYGAFYGGKPKSCFRGKFWSFNNIGGREGNI